jgi:hypothetical protein
MLPPILIDLSGTIDEFFLDENEVKSLSRYVLSSISDEYMRVWERNIDNSLHSTRSEYRRAIFTEQPDDYSMIFGMTPTKSKLAMMLEDGASAFDIKEGFENSEKKHLKKDGSGWYITVPFRHATSEAVAESMIFSNQMPKEIEQLVKTTGRPLNLADLPSQYRDVRTSSVGYVHRAAIYEGLKRTDISSTDKENRGGYFTFRRVSDKSEANSWQHPGFEPLKLMEKALSELRFDYIVDQSVDQFLTLKFAQ